MHHASHYDRTPRSRQEDTVLGPVVSGNQFNKIQQLISAGIREGATLVTGGIGRPEGLNRGYYVRPTVFGDVEPRMTIAREEIFGPVLSIMPYDTEDQAVEIANDTVYGLSACVVSNDIELAPRLARCERCRHRVTRREPRTIESPISLALASAL